jgi:hypothetical protein
MAYQFVGAKADPLARKGLGEVKSQLAELSKNNTMGKWELLETITVPAGGVASIERTKDAENVDYALKGVYVEMTLEPASAEESIYVDSYNGTNIISRLGGYKGIATTRNYVRTKCLIANGYWTGMLNNSLYLTNYDQFECRLDNELSYDIDTYPHIDKVTIYAQTTVIPAGSVIKIYGVR